MLLKDKIVLITVASSGVGMATALLCAIEGASIAFSYKQNKEGAEEVCKKLEKLGAKCSAFQADLSNDAEAKELVEKTLKQFGRIDVLVNNAGRYIGGDEWDGKSEVWHQSLGQSLVSVMSVSKYAIKHMQEKQLGVLVNVASRHSLFGQMDAISYASSKAGVVNITQAYAKLMAPWGRANAVSPGAVRAGYWKTAPQDELNENIEGTLLKKIIEPEDIADTIVFLASDKSRMITGQNIVVDAGYVIK